MMLIPLSHFLLPFTPLRPAPPSHQHSPTLVHVHGSHIQVLWLPYFPYYSYGHNCSILLLVTVVNLFIVPNLLIKLYHRYVCIGEKTHIYGVQYYLCSQASAGGLEMYPTH